MIAHHDVTKRAPVGANNSGSEDDVKRRWKERKQQPGGSHVSQRDCYKLILSVLQIKIGCHNCDGQKNDRMLQNLQWETKTSMHPV